MKPNTRRSFLKTSATIAAGMSSISVYPPALSNTLKSSQKVSPLEGIGREELKITDVKVTLLSFKLPKEKQWVSSTFLVPKTDAFLVEIFTDKGVVGMGESSPYRGMERMKQYIEEVIRPNLMGKNPFDTLTALLSATKLTSHKPTISSVRLWT